MAAVRDILKSKGKNVFAVTPKTTVYSALEMMVEKNVSSLMVTENEKLIGIFTERDYARKVILKGKSSRETPIEDIMTGKLITVSPSTTIDECMKLMSGNFIRHLPVVDDDIIIGLVSIGDLVRYIIEEQKFIIENMGNYIAGA